MRTSSALIASSLLIPVHMRVALRHEKCSYQLVDFARPYCSFFQPMSSENKETYEPADSTPSAICTIGDGEP